MNFSDKKKTLAEKKLALKIQLNKEFGKTHQKHLSEGKDLYCSSHWIGTINDLLLFNNAAQQTDCRYDFYTDKLESIFPYSDIIFFESDLIEEGEWDKSNNRWAPYGYQRTVVMLVNGKVKKVSMNNLSYQCVDISDLVDLSSEAELEELNKAHPSCFDINGNWRQPHFLGLLDIPMEELKTHSIERVYEDMWLPSMIFAENIEAGDKKTGSKRGKKSSNKSKEQLKKSFKGGFSSD